MFIASDARDVSTDAIAGAAERLLAAGLICICVWGPDCERAHDIFDEVHAGDGSTTPDFTLMSTWHSDESLEEALWFFIESAFPPGTEVATTSYLAITVGSSDWAAAVQRALADPAAFTARILNDELNSTGNAYTGTTANQA